MSAPAALLTVTQVAEILGVNVKVVYSLIEEGHLHGVNVGRGPQRPRWRFTAEQVDAFIAARSEGAA